MKIRRVLQVVILLICCSIASIAFASGYPDYLGGNRNLLFCGGHMGTGWYVDKTSLVVQEYNPPKYQIAVNVLQVNDADRGNTSYSVHTVYWRYDWNTRKMYRSNTGYNNWHYVPPTGSLAETGHEFSGEMAFYLAYHMKFYGSKTYWNDFLQKRVGPNCGTHIYDVVDNAD